MIHNKKFSQTPNYFCSSDSYKQNLVNHRTKPTSVCKIPKLFTNYMIFTLKYENSQNQSHFNIRNNNII